VYELANALLVMQFWV